MWMNGFLYRPTYVSIRVEIELDSPDQKRLGILFFSLSLSLFPLTAVPFSTTIVTQNAFIIQSSFRFYLEKVIRKEPPGQVKR